MIAQDNSTFINPSTPAAQAPPLEHSSEDSDGNTVPDPAPLRISSRSRREPALLRDDIWVRRLGEKLNHTH